MALSCPQNSVGATFAAADQGHRGTISVIVVPADVTPPQWTTPAGTQRGEWTANDGRTFVVLSEPIMPGGVAPFGSDVQHVATELSRM
ncbi:hypothetical protein [Actinophytocola sp.]|uniref:hypothetical protein n=1 Tax=Actinophytocola sp. TaxID=1872138 RepID=UPI002ED93B61